MLCAELCGLKRLGVSGAAYWEVVGNGVFLMCVRVGGVTRSGLLQSGVMRIVVSRVCDVRCCVFSVAWCIAVRSVRFFIGMFFSCVL